MYKDLKDDFLIAVSEWTCDEYYLDIRYFAVNHNHEKVVLRASIVLNPLPPLVDNDFRFESDLFLIGQLHKDKLSKKELIAVIENACNGTICLENDCLLSLKGDPDFSYYSEMLHNDKWFYNLHLRINGQSTHLPNQVEILRTDNMLRVNDPPFDGLVDVLMWLGFDGAQSLGSRASDINILVNPPVDILIDKCSLVNDKLKMYLLSHMAFNSKHVGLAIRPVPGLSVNSRKQLANEIVWTSPEGKYSEGIIETTIEKADSVLAMLMIGNHIVRKQWFLDPKKARNNRFLAVQNFDKDLKMVKRAVFEYSDSAKFENGIASLLFMLGFTPAVQIETNSPDLIVSTPQGRLIIVECTIRTADFSSKLGKLVDRRGSLTKALVNSGHHSEVHAVMACRLPRDQIAATEKELAAAKVILITEENLNQAFVQVRLGADPDVMIRDAESRLASDSNYEQH